MTTVFESIGHSLPSAPRAMRIHINSGIGSGPTELAAFDAALMNAGVANYNLRCLSSVIPPRAEIVHECHLARAEDYGRRLYVVMSQMRESKPGSTAHAGIGWVQNTETGCGLFVELHDSSRNRLECDLEATLEAMRGTRPFRYGPVQVKISSALCTDRPVCALVVAVYACEPW